MTRRRSILSAVLAAAMLAGSGLPASPAQAKDGGVKVEKVKAKSSYASANGRKNR
jgi:hypothetical protein